MITIRQSTKVTDGSKSASAERCPMMVRVEQRIGQTASQETRYDISSLENDAKLALRAACGHWGIENGLHWVLDIAFREDERRVRQDHGPENLAVLRISR